MTVLVGRLPTTDDRARTCRWPKTPRSLVRSPDLARAASSRSHTLVGRVEEERGGVQVRRRLERAASFVAALAEKTITPFLRPAHRTGRDHLGHPALGRVSH